MIRSIVKKIVPLIEALNFSDLVAGIITPATKKIINSSGNAVTKLFPIYENTPQTCKSGDYIILTPDEKYKSVIYFEEVNSIVISQSNYEIKLQSDIRLVGWFNLKKININATSDLFSQLLIQAIPEKIADFGQIYNINIEFNGIENKNPLIFSSYTYDESETQYLLFPYDYCALRYTVNYAFNKSCEPDLSIIENCGKK